MYAVELIRDNEGRTLTDPIFRAYYINLIDSTLSSTAPADFYKA